MKYFVQVNGRDHEVEVVERLGELRVSVGGEPLEIHYEEVDALGQAALIVEGRAFGVSIEGAGSELSVVIAGRRYDVEIEDERERAAHAADRARAGRGGMVKSVMPGIVVGLLVGEGDDVQEGQPLLILEAMKMQNEIVADHEGRVVRLHVAEGQAVGAGEPLVSIEVDADA